MGESLKREVGRVRAINVQIQENQCLKERISQIENDIETSTELMPLFKEQFVECMNNLNIGLVDWNKNTIKLLKFGENVIQLDAL